MGKLRRPELPPGPLDQLVRELHGLHARAGWPSTRELARGQEFSYTAVHELFTKTISEPPRLPVLHRVVERLATMAPRTNLEETLDRFDALWRAAAEEPPEEPYDVAATTIEVTSVPDVEVIAGRAFTKELFFLANSAPPLHDAAAELRRAGFLVRDQPRDIDGMWSLMAYSAASDLSSKDLATLDDIAERCGVEFDGWGTYVGPPELDDGPGKPPISTEPSSGPLFRTGKVLVTPKAAELSRRLGVGQAELVRRHTLGDWGELSPEEVEDNERAVRSGQGGIFSGYGEGEQRLLVVTEPERLVTRILTPEEL